MFAMLGSCNFLCQELRIKPVIRYHVCECEGNCQTSRLTKYQSLASLKLRVYEIMDRKTLFYPVCDTNCQ